MDSIDLDVLTDLNFTNQHFGILYWFFFSKICGGWFFKTGSYTSCKRTVILEAHEWGGIQQSIIIQKENKKKLID